MIHPTVQWFFSLSSVSNLLAILFLLFGLFCTAIVVLIPRPWGHVIKLLGAVVVIGLSLAANSAFVYGISVFIVATLVTDLEFLEKLAAIIWNRKEYWQYLIDRAPSTEVDAKRSSEALDSTSETPSSHAEEFSQPLASSDITQSEHNVRLQFIRRFEEAVISALNKQVPPFQDCTVTPSVRLHSSHHTTQRVSRIIDAIVRRNGVTYVVEIKAYRSQQSLPRAVYQLQSLCQMYTAAVSERGETTQVVPVLVIPAEIETNTVFDGVVVLRFDVGARQFKNAIEANHIFRMQ